MAMQTTHPPASATTHAQWLATLTKITTRYADLWDGESATLDGAVMVLVEVTHGRGRVAGQPTVFAAMLEYDACIVAACGWAACWTGRRWAAPSEAR